MYYLLIPKDTFEKFTKLATISFLPWRVYEKIRLNYNHNNHLSYGYQRIEDIKVQNVDAYYFEQKDDYQTVLAEINGDGTENEIIVTQ